MLRKLGWGQADGCYGMTGEPTIKIDKAKGRQMLQWFGKRPLREIRSFPAQLVDRFGAPADQASADLVGGSYRIDRPAGADRPMAVRHTDMLGEEVLIVEPR